MFRKSWIAGVLPLIDVRVIDCSGAGGSAPRGQSLLRQQVGCALLPAPSPRCWAYSATAHASSARTVRGTYLSWGHTFAGAVGSEDTLSSRRGVECQTVGARLSTYPGGRGGKERAANLLAEQRLAPGGGAPCPGAVNYTNVNKRQNPCDPALAKHSHAPSWRNL